MPPVAKKNREKFARLNFFCTREFSIYTIDDAVIGPAECGQSCDHVGSFPGGDRDKKLNR